MGSPALQGNRSLAPRFQLARCVIVLATLTLSTAILAAPVNYATTSVSIKAGVVIPDDTEGYPGVLNTLVHGVSVAPFALYNLNNALQVKPIGWNIYNPNAPGAATADMVTRWQTIQTYGVSVDLPVAGSPIDKSKAEYWSVYLSQVTDQVLDSYNLLLLNPAYFSQLRPQEIARLSRFVDQGGILWIDPSGVGASLNNQDLFNGFPLAFEVVNPTSGGTYADQFDPLLNTPQPISNADLNYLHHYFQYGLQAAPAPPNNWGEGIPSQFDRFKTITAVGTSPTISVAHQGNGAVVVTPTGVSQILNNNNGSNLGTNLGYTAQPTHLGNDGIAAAKLVINMIYELGDFRGVAGGSRNAGGNAIDITAPVLARWSADTGTSPGGTSVYTTPLNGISPNTPPVLYKGAFVAVTGNTTGSTTACLTVFKAVPGTDLDGDGDPDDGLGSEPYLLQQPKRDYSVGYPYNVIWVSAPLTPPLSAPVCFEVNNALNGLPRDEVAVVDGNGDLHVFGLFDKDNNGRLIGGVHPLTTNGNQGMVGNAQPGQELYELIPPNGSTTGANIQLPGAGSQVPNAPTIQEDLAFISDATDWTNQVGRVWVADLTSGQLLADTEAAGGTETNPWYTGGVPYAGGQSPLPSFTAPCTVGYIPIQDGSNGSDRVIYGPGTSGSGFIPTLASIWLGVRGESPSSIAVVNSVGSVGSGGTDTVTVNTRLSGIPNGPDLYYAGAGASPAQQNLAPKITLLNANNNPLTANQMNAAAMSGLTSQGSGVFTFTINDSAWAAGGTQGLGVRVDYTIDWGSNGGGNWISLERGLVQLPVKQTAGANLGLTDEILGPVALTPAGTVVLDETDVTTIGSGGCMFWFREDQGRGVFRMTGRYSLYTIPNGTIPLSGATPVSWPAPFENFDPLVGVINKSLGTTAFTSTLNGFYWTGPPVVQGNQAYATAGCTTSFNGTATVSCTIAMAFAAEPPQPTIQLPGGLETGTQFAQPDYDRDPSGATFSSLGSGSYVYDSSTNRIEFPTLANPNIQPEGFKGQISDSLNLSLPVILRTPGSPDIWLDPTAAGGTWSPLQWYSVFLGSGVEGASGSSSGPYPSYSPPLVTGNTLFFATSSVLPNLLSGQGLTNKAVIEAIDGIIPSGDPNVTTDPLRPYQRQVNQVDGSNGNITGADPHIRMPQATSLTSLAQFAATLNEATLGTSSDAYGLAGGGNALATWGNNGIYGLSRADFLVCDQGRLVRVDSSGNALWASNSNVNSGPGGGGFAGNVTQLVRPTKAYPVGQSEVLVVDTGGNRVVKLDESGLEERAISKFFADPQYRPNGFQTNEPLSLSGPRDAITYSGYVYQAVTGTVVSNQQSVEYWVHYLIADSGHKRLVELIDRYTVDPTTGNIGPLVTVSMPDPNQQPINSGGLPQAIPTRNVPQAGVLWWQSPASVSGKNFDYNSISRVFLNSVSSNGRYVYVAGIGSAQPTQADVGLSNPVLQTVRQSATGSGGVVVFDPQSPTGIQVYNKWDMPGTQSTPFWDATTSAFDTQTSANVAAQGARPLTGVTSVTARAIVNQSTGKSYAQVMVSCSDGVIEAVVDPTTTSDDLGTPDWWMPNAAFTAIWTPNGQATVNAQGASQFIPTYASRLDSGEIMLVNGYTGTTLGGAAYNGEVLMLAGSTMSFPDTNQNLGFNLSSIHFFLPPISGARNLTAPVFADRR